MTNSNHPITPSPELIQQWLDEWINNDLPGTAPQYIATQAAQWGANQELEACCEWLNFYAAGAEATDLRAARRPQPKSLAEEGLQAVTAIKNMADDYKQFDQDVDTIRRALERLQELEGQADD